jgi:hypothetical protein
VERRAELRSKGKATTARSKAAVLEDDLDMRRYIEVGLETFYSQHTDAFLESRIPNGEWERYRLEIPPLANLDLGHCTPRADQAPLSASDETSYTRGDPSAADGRRVRGLLSGECSFGGRDTSTVESPELPFRVINSD